MTWYRNRRLLLTGARTSVNGPHNERLTILA